MGALRLKLSAWVVGLFSVMQIAGCDGNTGGQPSDTTQPPDDVPADGTGGAAAGGTGTGGAAAGAAGTGDSGPPTPDIDASDASCSHSSCMVDYFNPPGTCEAYCKAALSFSGSYPCNNYQGKICQCTGTASSCDSGSAAPTCSQYNCMVDGKTCSDWCGSSNKGAPCDSGVWEGYWCQCHENPAISWSECSLSCYATTCKVADDQTCEAYCQANPGSDGAPCLAPFETSSCLCNPPATGDASSGESTPSPQCQQCNASLCHVSGGEDCNHYCADNGGSGITECTGVYSTQECECGGGAPNVCQVPACNASTCWVSDTLDCNHHCVESREQKSCLPPYSDQVCTCGTTENVCESPVCNASTCWTDAGGEVKDCNHYCLGDTRDVPSPCMAPYADYECTCGSSQNVCEPYCTPSMCKLNEAGLDCTEYCKSTPNGAPVACMAPLDQQNCACDGAVGECEARFCNASTCWTDEGGELKDCNHFCATPGHAGAVYPCMPPFTGIYCDCQGGPNGENACASIGCNGSTCWTDAGGTVQDCNHYCVDQRAGKNTPCVAPAPFPSPQNCYCGEGPGGATECKAPPCSGTLCIVDTETGEDCDKYCDGNKPTPKACTGRLSGWKCVCGASVSDPNTCEAN